MISESEVSPGEFTDFTNIQPRLKVNWDIKGTGRDFLSAGAGIFMGGIVTRPYVFSMIDNGIRYTNVDVSRGLHAIAMKMISVL